ncbi:MAG: hypothetical protein KGQ46_11135 [Hyphomicrobiales bacterium]|nr:hypothetical protein [Hyphomicrobiales bacterium]MDE2113300.1 hypothetical protein [Hyphomicrobiales bacterium]
MRHIRASVRRFFYVPVTLLGFAGLAMAANTPVTKPQAAPVKDHRQTFVSYVLPRDDGYGLSDCLTGGTSCGQMVADMWCKSHGNGPSVFIGSSSDVTGALPEMTKVNATDASAKPSDSVIVRCKA